MLESSARARMMEMPMPDSRPSRASDSGGGISGSASTSKPGPSSRTVTTMVPSAQRQHTLTGRVQPERLWACMALVVASETATRRSSTRSGSKPDSSSAAAATTTRTRDT